MLYGIVVVVFFYFYFLNLRLISPNFMQDCLFAGILLLLQYRWSNKRIEILFHFDDNKINDRSLSFRLFRLFLFFLFILFLFYFKSCLPISNLYCLCLYLWKIAGKYKHKLYNLFSMHTFVCVFGVQFTVRPRVVFSLYLINPIYFMYMLYR